MQIHNFCTPNGNKINRLTKTANAYKERILSQITINTFKKCERGGIETQSEVMVAATWWLFSQLQKNSVLQIDRFTVSF